MARRRRLWSVAAALVRIVSAPPPPRGGVRLCRLWERRDHTGQLFMSGTLGGARVLILPNQDRADDSDAEFVLVLAENAKDRKPKKERTP